MKKSIKKGVVVISSMVFMSVILLAFTPGIQKPWNVPAKYKSMKNPVKNDQASINAGKATYAKHCKSCHGTKGLGDGPKATTLKTKIPSFATKEFKARANGDVYYQTIIGRDEMPNIEKKILDESERWNLVNYLYSF